MKHLFFILVLFLSSCCKEEKPKTMFRVINDTWCTYEIFGNNKSWDTLPPGYYQEFNPPIGEYTIEAVKVKGDIIDCKPVYSRTIQLGYDMIIEWKISN